MASRCRQLLFVRRGEARSPTKQARVWVSVEECPFWYFRQSDSVTCQQTSLDTVSHMVQGEATQRYLPLESLSAGQQCVLNSHKVQIATRRRPQPTSGVTLGRCAVDVAELLEPGMGQNDTEARSHSLTAVLQDFSSPVDPDDAFPALTTNIAKEGGTLQHLSALLVQSLTDLQMHI